MSEENGFSWTVEADLPGVRRGAASVIHDGQLWLMGGLNEDGEETASVLIYDMNGGWVTGPALPRAIWGCRAISTDGEILISGASGEEYHAFAYRNTAWVEVTGTPSVGESSEIQALLLG